MDKFSAGLPCRKGNCGTVQHCHCTVPLSIYKVDLNHIIYTTIGLTKILSSGAPIGAQNKAPQATFISKNHNTFFLAAKAQLNKCACVSVCPYVRLKV